MIGLRIIALANGEPSEFDNSFVTEYDPAVHREEGTYDGGILEVTRDPAKARTFSSAREAMEYWRQSYGLREDGKPNRPLTAWTVEIADIGRFYEQYA